jgi:hypothetical protein
MFMHRKHKFKGCEHMFKACEHKFTGRKHKICMEGIILCTFICLLSFLFVSLQPLLL